MIHKLLLSLLLLALAIQSSAADQPNILWLTCEDMSPDLGCYGDTYAKTYTTNNVKTDYNLSAPDFVQTAWAESSKTGHWRKRPAGKPFFSVFNYTDTHQSMSSRDDYAAFAKKVQSRISPSEIHDPAKAPLPPYYPDTPTARRTVARYYDCISTLDVWVKEKLAELEADGLAQDTIVFFLLRSRRGPAGWKSRRVPSRTACAAAGAFPGKVPL